MSVVNQMLKDLEYRDAAARKPGIRLVLGAAANDAVKPRHDRRILLILGMGLASIGFVAAAAWETWKPNPAPARPLASTAPTVTVEARPPGIPGVTDLVELPPLAVWPAPVAATAVPQQAGSTRPSVRPAEPAATPAAATASATTPIAVQGTSTESASSELGNIRSGWSPGRTRFVFKFDRWPAEVKLDQGDGQQIGFHFADTASSAAPPTRPAADRLLAAIELQRAGGSLGFLFQAVKDARITASYHRMTQDGDWPYWLVLDLAAAETAPLATDPAEKASIDTDTTAADLGSVAAPVDPPPPADRAAATPDAAQAKNDTLLRKQMLPTDAAVLARSALADAHAAVRDGDTRSAIELAEQAVALAPAEVAARELLAGLLIRTGDARAEPVLVESLQRLPGHAGLSQIHARLLIAQSREQEALAVLDAAVGRTTADADFLALRAATHQRLQQHEAAIENYMLAINQVRGQGLWWLGLAISLEALEHHDEALAAYREAFDSNRLQGDVRQFAERRIAELGVR